MSRLYTDEHIDPNLTERLRQRGHDVVTVAELGLAGGSDAQVLADATADGRAVLTYNRWHFEKLHRQNPAHAGIISCTPDDDLAALAARIDDALAGASSLTGWHIRVDRPP